MADCLSDTCETKFRCESYDAHARLNLLLFFIFGAGTILIPMIIGGSFTVAILSLMFSALICFILYAGLYSIVLVKDRQLIVIKKCYFIRYEKISASIKDVSIDEYDNSYDFDYDTSPSCLTINVASGDNIYVGTKENISELLEALSHHVEVKRRDNIFSANDSRNDGKKHRKRKKRKKRI